MTQNCHCFCTAFVEHSVASLATSLSVRLGGLSAGDAHEASTHVQYAGSGTAERVSNSWTAGMRQNIVCTGEKAVVICLSAVAMLASISISSTHRFVTNNTPLLVGSSRSVRSADDTTSRHRTGLGCVRRY